MNDHAFKIVATFELPSAGKRKTSELPLQQPDSNDIDEDSDPVELHKKGYSVKSRWHPPGTEKTRSHARDTSDFDAAASFRRSGWLALGWSCVRPSPAD
jgi:hypothetical protein